MSTSISRRRFLQLAGLTIAVTVTPSGYTLLAAREAEGEQGQEFRPHVWLRITPDNKIIITVNKSEMGQGVYTSLPMIIADELEADWKQVSVEGAPAREPYKDPVWGSQSTGGSTSIRHMYEPLRKAGAAAREMLVSAAAELWKVPEAECEASLGKVIHIAGSNAATYGELAVKAAERGLPKNPALKKSQYRYIGSSLPRLDLPDKSNGSATFGIDIMLPGMLYALVVRPYTFGAKVVAVDDAEAKNVKGLERIVEIYRGVAVCAETVAAARQARNALHIVWDAGVEPNLNTAGQRKRFADHLTKKGLVARQDGNARKALSTSTVKIESLYWLPYLGHATMEPMNCTAHVRKDRCDVWAPTQNQTGTLMTAQKLTGLRPEQIHVHTGYLGGGFGRRFEQDFVEEAVQISKITYRPVQVLWTREEDFQYDYFRPGNISHIQGSLDDKGSLMAWSHKIVCPSIFARVFPERVKDGIDSAAVEGVKNLEYDVPNVHVEYVKIDTPVPVGFWRSVGSSHNAFTVESFVDEMAHLAKKDPLAFRLEHLGKYARARRVLEAAADKAGWDKLPKEGIGRGIAYHHSFGSYVAQVADVSLNRRDGIIKVHKIICAVDCGKVINPDTVKAQMMGAVVMGLSAALKEQITFAKGRVETENFDSYPLLRMSETPEIEVHIIESGDNPGGVGEPGLPPVAPAVANAVFRLTGVRLRSLPMNPEAVVAALRDAAG